MIVFRKMLKVFSLMLVICYLIVISFGYYNLRSEVDSLKNTKPYKNIGNLISWQDEIGSIPEATSSGNLDTKSTQTTKQSSGFSFKDCVDCDKEIQLMIDESLENIPSSNTVSQAQKTQTTYIPLGSSSSSTSTNWFTISEASSFIDLINDFSSSAYVTYEASLKVLHGNGQAFARLWDDTNKIAVVGSEISTTNNSDFQHVKSPQVYLWNGNNNYKLQIKSLNGYEVTITDSKVKIVY